MSFFSSKGKSVILLRGQVSAIIQGLKVSGIRRKKLAGTDKLVLSIRTLPFYE